MASVTLTIGGRPHQITCRDGEEARVRQLGEMIDQRWLGAQRAAGGSNGERAMLFVALMLADDLDEMRAGPVERVPTEGASVSEGALTRLAERLEALAATLEQSATNA